MTTYSDNGKISQRLLTRTQFSSERGASMVEYALLIALIAILAFGGLTAFGGGLGAEYEDINNTIDEQILISRE